MKKLQGFSLLEILSMNLEPSKGTRLGRGKL